MLVETHDRYRSAYYLFVPTKNMMCDDSHKIVWGLVLPAVRAALTAGRTKMDDGRWHVSRYPMPEYTVNEFGWPQAVRRDLILSRDSDPPNWRGMFSIEASGLHIPISEVPELELCINTLAELALTDPFIDRLVNFRPGVHDADFKKYQWLETGALILVEKILERVEALELQSDSELEELLTQLEIAHQADTLPVNIMAPLLLTRVEGDTPINLGGNLWLEPMSEEVQMARAEAVDGYRSENPYLLAAATHAVVVRGVEIVVGPHPGVVSFASIDRTLINRALEVIQIVGDGPCGYAELLAVPKGWANGWKNSLPPIQGELIHSEYPSLFKETGWRKPPAVLIDEKGLNALPDAFSVLTSSKANVRVAARRVRRCVMRSDREDILLDATIGLEALLGNSRDELTHRLAQRAAAALAERIDPREMYTVVKQIYSYRSKVVHGAELKTMRINMGEDWYSAPDVARYVLQELLHELLSGAKWTPETLDARIIAKLSD